MLKLALTILITLSCVACSDRSTTETRRNEPPSPTRVASTRGGAIVLSGDERIAVAANRTAGVITVIRLDPTLGPEGVVPEAIDTVELELPAGAEPWAAVIGRGDDTAYVVLRGLGVVQRVTDLDGSPKLDGVVSVGSEPTAIAISPSGRNLFVANWGDGTVSILRTDPFDEPSRFDLNEKLAASGVLGDVTARPGLAHPRALAMTDNGDDEDGDETLYVTDFFSQPLPDVVDDPDHLSLDKNRQGFVYTIPVSSRNFPDAPVFTLPPVLDTGFLDGEARPTSCFPNQLYAAAVDGGRLFVTAMCASPRGPVGPRDPMMNPTKANFKTMLHPAIFVLDPNAETPVTSVLLTRELEAAYATDGGAVAARLPLIPNDIAFAPPDASGAHSAYVTAFGTNAVFRVDFEENGALRGVGSPNARFTNLKASRGGVLPVGVALSRVAAQPFALILNDNSQNLSVIDRTSGLVAQVRAVTSTERAQTIRNSPENTGRRLFATGLHSWSLDAQGWNSCESCHPDGLSDGLTWSFTRGPRRTLSTASTYDRGEPEHRRVLLWTANADEVEDVEVIARTIHGGVGGILWQYSDPASADCRILYDGKGCAMTSPPGTCQLTGGGGTPCGAPKHSTTLLSGLNGSLGNIVRGIACDATAETCDTTSVDDWQNIDAFIRSVRGPRSPRVGPQANDLPTLDVDLGIQLFQEGRCAACHGGPGWTISKVFYTPNAANNGALPYLPPETGILDLVGALRRTTYRPDPLFPAELNPPSLGGEAPLRSWAPADGLEATLRTYAYDTGQANDQINCVLRDVGTFPPQMPAPEAANTVGIVAPGAPPVPEVRQDMKTLAFGASGFNVPSLLHLATRAPYFHAGNARTLEEAFDPVFRAHYQAIVPDFLEDSADRDEKVRALVAFLLSIDETTRLEDVPTDLGFDPVLCPPPED